MFFVFLALGSIVLGLLGVAAEAVNQRRGKSQGGGEALACFMTIISVFVAAAGILVGLLAHSDHVSDSVELVKVKKFEAIYTARSENLTKEFAHYLAELYPEHERSIFDKIKPAELDIYLAKYPEVRSSETIVQLVKQVRELEDARYAQQLRRAEIIQSMTYRTRSPWVLQFLMPDNIEIPAE